jgi:hypothetical protein
MWLCIMCHRWLSFYWIFPSRHLDPTPGALLILCSGCRALQAYQTFCHHRVGSLTILSSLHSSEEASQWSALIHSSNYPCVHRIWPLSDHHPCTLQNQCQCHLRLMPRQLEIFAPSTENQELENIPLDDIGSCVLSVQ